MEGLVGQDPLRRKLASVFSQYTLYRIDPDAGRPNCFIYGRSGSGKTFAVELCSKVVGLPMTVVSAAGISPPSYRGRTMMDVLIQHWRDYGTDQGVIFVDEVDKWTLGSLTTRDPERETNGRVCQFEMLKFLEREKVTFSDDSKDIEELAGVVFNTSNILWVMAGAFTHLDKVIRRRLHNSYLPEDEIYENAIPGDFKKYGIVEEFADRVSSWVWTTPLKVVDMIEILRTQDVPKWTRRFQAIDRVLEVDPGALGACAQHAYEQKEGPRIAKAMLNRALDDLFEEESRVASEEIVHVTASLVVSGARY